MLIVVILVAFVPAVLLTVVTLLLSVLRLVLTFVTFVLTEFSKLLIVVRPTTVKFVSNDPSPICFPKTDPVEIVEKKP